MLGSPVNQAGRGLQAAMDKNQIVQRAAQALGRQEKESEKAS